MITCLISSVGNSLYSALGSNQLNVDEQDTNQILFTLQQDEGLRSQVDEIRSIETLLQQRHIEKKELYFLLPGTDQGRNAGEVLKLYFLREFKNVQLISIDGLDENNIREYQEEGLRNLVQNTTRIFYKCQQAGEECLINATGGDKIESAFLGTIGQMLKVPVYYEIDNRKSVLPLPALPVSIDYSFWLKHFSIFDNAYRNGVIPAELLDKYAEIDEIIGLFDEFGAQYRLSSVGLLMHEASLHRFSKDGALHLPTLASKEVKELPNFIGDVPLALITDLESMLQLDYVISIGSTRKKQDIPNTIKFKAVDVEEGIILGTFSDGRHSWKYEIKTTAQNRMSLNAACVDLNLRFGQPFEMPKPGTVEFLLIRHGQHTGEPEGRIEGWADFELTDFGKLQANELSKKLKQEYTVDALYTSSLKRAEQTAQIIGDFLNLSPILMDDLRALQYGLSEGLTKQEALIRYPKNRDFHTPSHKQWGRESDFEFTSRILESFFEIYQSHPGQTVAIVTHGRVISTIMKEIFHLPVSKFFSIESGDTSVHHFVMGPDKTVIHHINNTDHLKNLRGHAE